MWHAHDAVMAVCHLPTLCDHYYAAPSDDDGAARTAAVAAFVPPRCAASRDGYSLVVKS